MTSTCSQSASGPTSPTASARPPKSADNRDGAIRSIAASLPAAFAIPGTVGFGTVRAEPFAGREPQTAYPLLGVHRALAFGLHHGQTERSAARGHGRARHGARGPGDDRLLGHGLGHEQAPAPEGGEGAVE